MSLIFQNYELILTDGKFEVIQRVPGGEVPYKVRYMGIYMVIDTTAGLVLLWDKKTSIFIKLGPEYEVRNGPNKSFICFEKRRQKLSWEKMYKTEESKRLSYNILPEISLNYKC